MRKFSGGTISNYGVEESFTKQGKEGELCLHLGVQVHVTGPPKTDFENEKYIINLYLFCTILYNKSQILYTIPSCAISNSNLGGGDMQPPPNAVSP